MRSYHQTILAAAALFLGSQCQNGNSNTAEIKSTAAACKQAILTHDEKSLSSLLTTDATDYNLTRQETVSGSDNVAGYLISLLPSEQTPEVAINIESIKPKNPDTIRVKGVLDLHSGSEQQVAFSVDFKKEEDSWKIAQISHLLLQPAPSHYEQLKELNWLVGHWVNQDEDTSFSASYTWDMNKNFLIQQFSLTILGHKQLAGIQRIGFDPINNTIRSWVFDTDGGFGESSWTHDDGTWYVTTSFTLSDGRKSSATQIFKQVDDTTYTFSSVGRDVDGRMLPNIGPFTIVKDKVGL